MQHALLRSPIDSADFQPNPIFNVVIAYEDFETGKQAKRTYDFLSENLGRECRLASHLWKFDVLNLPKLREMAVKDALTADIIIISSHGGELPDSVKSWIESWLMQPCSALALVALFDCSAEEAARGARTYLADVARRGKMEFFAQPDVWPAHRFSEGIHQPEAGKGGRTLSVLAGAVQRDIPTLRWGINE